ncbi:MAG: hypothetical protein ABJC26_17205, partial [Gemmatimonadaceae bacterium]
GVLREVSHAINGLSRVRACGRQQCKQGDDNVSQHHAALPTSQWSYPGKIFIASTIPNPPRPT